VILAQLSHFASHTVNSLAMFQDEGQTVGFSPIQLWDNMGWLVRCVVIVLFIESIWSLAVMIDRYLYFSAARKQSREFAPKVAGALKESKLEEAIKIADRNKKSHLAEVVTAGLQEFRASSGTATDETIASSGRALERAEAIVHAKLKRGLSVLATIGAVAGGISEALVTTAFGLFVAIPAVMAFNYFTGRVESFDVEMDNSSSELVDYFIKQSHKR